ncbi:MAG: DUF2269 family protein [Actinomycetota bacterium]
MSTEELRSLLLWLHIAVAIVGFGPTFTFPVWAVLARKAGPEHVPFALRGIGLVARRMVVPMAVLLPFTGVALIFVAGVDLWASEWLWISVALYTIGFFVNVGIALPNLSAMLGMFERGEMPASAEEFRRRGARQRLLGLYSMANLLVILGLMVWKPGA